MIENFKHPSLPSNTLKNLANSLDFWKQSGATYIDLPWVAPQACVRATCPPWVDIDSKDIKTPHGYLLASGEQAFIHLAQTKSLANDIYIGWTPCFREEDFDALHHFYFIKAECFVWVDGWSDDNDKSWRLLVTSQLNQILNIAKSNFNYLLDLNNCLNLKDKMIIMQTQPVLKNDFIQFDILINSIEIGSFGVRREPVSGRPYIYGTVLAEPRFSTVIKI